MKSKLIIVEGLPGSGKSTTARLIDSVLKEMGVKTELYCEGNLDHPADYDGVAYYSKDKFEHLICQQKNLASLINSITEIRGEDYFIPYVKEKKRLGEEFPDELFRLVSNNDIYELPLNEHIRLITERWQEFVKYARKTNDDKTYIFECCFIQNPVTVTMLRDNSSKDVTGNYVEKLAEIIEDINPILFYVNQNSTEDSFNKVIEERPEGWLSFFIDYYTNQGYGKANNLAGLDGTIEMLKARKELELEIYEKLSMDKFIIDNSEYDSTKTERKIKSILERYLQEF